MHQTDRRGVLEPEADGRRSPSDPPVSSHIATAVSGTPPASVSAMARRGPTQR